MGGWMTYQRMRERNGVTWRASPDRENPYPDPDCMDSARQHLICGDMNRMERDYLNPVYPEPPWATRTPGSDPAAECAARTGVDIEDVRAVLHYVFMEQR
jgi:hypothetical protein